MKSTTISIIIAVCLIVGAVIFYSVGGTVNSNLQNNTSENGIGNNSENSNVQIVEGKQIIEIDVKGGYSPRQTVAKAGIPTILRFKTEATFDCSLSVRIPAMRYSKFLPQTGVIEVDLGTKEVGKLFGTCGMGMYSFNIDFI